MRWCSRTAAGPTAPRGRSPPGVNEADDGADTIDWLTRQPWCDGEVGTFGASYLGMIQWSAAEQASAGLKAYTAN